MKQLSYFVSCVVVACGISAADDSSSRSSAMTSEQFIKFASKYKSDLEKTEKQAQQLEKFKSVSINNHKMTYIPDSGILFSLVRSIDLSNGKLASCDTIPALLKCAPSLRILKLSHNQIPALCEGEINTYFPTHDDLAQLDCSHNAIKSVDFTVLCKKLPNLIYLNVSDCPVTEFNVIDVKRTTFAPTIDLRNTNLSDAQKKEILKNASVPCVHKGVGTLAVLSTVFPTTVYAVAFFPLTLRIPLSAGLGVVVASVCADVVWSALLGAGTVYLGVLGFTEPEARFQPIYNPLLDNANYPEEEITSCYSRFVKRFPYFCCCDKNGGDEELNEVEEV